MPFKLKTVTKWVEMDFMSGGMQSSAAANRSRSHAACRWPPTSFTRFRSRELYFIFVSFVQRRKRALRITSYRRKRALRM